MLGAAGELFGQASGPHGDGHEPGTGQGRVSLKTDAVVRDGTGQQPDPLGVIGPVSRGCNAGPKGLKKNGWQRAAEMRAIGAMVVTATEGKNSARPPSVGSTWFWERKTPPWRVNYQEVCRESRLSA